MPRPMKIARKIGNSSKEKIKEGILLIRNGMSIRQAAKTTNVAFATLKRYFNKTKDCESLEGLRLEPNYSVNRIFTLEQEQVLKEYFTHCSLLFYGLTAKETRHVAYQCAEINKIKMPASWKEKEIAGKDWLLAFRRRHDVSLKKPEPCSLSRATAFNRHNVEIFFDNLESLLKRHPSFSDGTRIYNLDETSTTTVQKPQKVIAPKGRKTIGKVTSGERGTLVTTCCVVSASGNFLPPVMIFPRKKFKEHMIKNTPPGTLGLATPTGWMNSTIFPCVIKHFIKHTNSSKDNPAILIMDNHESHLCLEALDLAKNAGVHILTLHPHTSAKLQPLDVGLYGPFKTYYNAAIDSWMLTNPGKPVTIYDLGEIIGTAFQKAMTPRNIINSFAKCGIYPFDRHIFTDEDFLPSSVTDRPCPANRDEDTCSPISVSLLDETNRLESPLEIYSYFVTSPDSNGLTSLVEAPGEANLLASDSTTEQSKTTIDQTGPVASTSQQQPVSPENQFTAEDEYLKPAITTENTTTSCSMTTMPSSSTGMVFKSPFEFRHPVKAGPRQTNRKRRKPGRSLIATDTPEKLLLEQEKNNKRKNDGHKRKIVRTILESDDENENDDVQLAESDDDIDWPDEIQDENEEEEVVLSEEDLTKPLPYPPKEGEYVIVQLTTKKQRSLYIGKVLEERNHDMEFYISFLRRKPGTDKFHMPNKPDLSLVKEDDLKYILPKPSMAGTASRPFYNFPIDFTFLTIQ